MALEIAQRCGLSTIALHSRWRQSRLLILCYHGVAHRDEHQWDPCLYVRPGHLRRRLELLRKTQCNVLPLDTAVQLLYSGDLPPRSVALTFDDGTYDFYERAAPLLREFDMPATVYLTTYYATHPWPVFDTMCSYLLWKGREGMLAWPRVFGETTIRLDDAGRVYARGVIETYASERRLSGAEKAELLHDLARHLQIDYDALLERRILQLMTLQEAEQLARSGFDLQLHTHRHAVSMKKDVFAREIDENRRLLDRLRPSPARHFCYPSCVHRPELVRWLRECHIASATTCNPGLATQRTDRLLLPRMVDTSLRSDAEFLTWLSGLAGMLPSRSYAAVPGRVLG